MGAVLAVCLACPDLAPRTVGEERWGPWSLRSSPWTPGSARGPAWGRQPVGQGRVAPEEQQHKEDSRPQQRSHRVIPKIGAYKNWHGSSEESLEGNPGNVTELQWGQGWTIFPLRAFFCIFQVFCDECILLAYAEEDRITDNTVFVISQVDLIRYQNETNYS